MNPLVHVYSFPRSGNNLLCSLLKKNFYSNVDVSAPAGTWGHWGHRRQAVPTNYGKLFGHHGPVSMRAPGPAIYVYRDGRAVALSVHRSDGFLNEDMKKLPLSEFLLTPLDWKYSPAFRCEPTKTVVESWLEHVEEWYTASKTDPSIKLVRYEDLVTNLPAVLEELLVEVGLYFVNGLHAVDERVGYSPNEGEVDTWKKHFTAEDLAVFHRTVPTYSRFLWKGETGGNDG